VRCDLHVHSYYSGPCTTPVLGKFCRESYSQPEAVYEKLARLGMDLVTLTDHDSIEGAAQLAHHPNFFTSCELTCTMPSGTVAHVGVYDISERQHAELLRRRNDLPALIAYLSEKRLFFSINHVFSSLTGAREREDFRMFRNYFPAMESLNGHMLESQNSSAARLADIWNKVQVGGSDSHAMPSVGSAWTEVPGARNKEEFFAGLRAGQGIVGGEAGTFAKLTRDVFVITFELMCESKWPLILSPLAVLIPAFTAWNYRDEAAFVRRWASELIGAVEFDSQRRWARGSRRPLQQIMSAGIEEAL
jgi:predicted metal-dependent phosphoesterase TrpH